MKIIDQMRFYYNSGALAHQRSRERRMERWMYMQDPEHDEYYFEAFGRQVCKMLVREKGKVPITMRSMSKSRDGLVLIGRMTDEKLREAEDENYTMLKFMAEQDAEELRKGEPTPPLS